jgi:geranylgeranyl diphosphate synthase, type I
MNHLESVKPYLAETERLIETLLTQGAAQRLSQAAKHHMATGGKRIRARLALAATQALGPDPRKAVGWAAACEMLHNATLVHDDIQDGDRTRRGRPTTWTEFGVNEAINVGDLMLMLPLDAIAQTPVDDRERWFLARSLGQQAADVVRGQSLEMTLPTLCGKPGLRDQYVATIAGKTAALFVLPVEGAAIIAGHVHDHARALGNAFGPLGLVFQLQDDILDLWGEKGRDVHGADIREGKVSSLVVEHLALHPEDTAWLTRILKTPRDETSNDDVEAVIDRFRQGGALRASLSHIDRLANEFRKSKTLATEPGLRSLADELLDLILEPIAHVTAD